MFVNGSESGLAKLLKMFCVLEITPTSHLPSHCHNLILGQETCYELL